MDVILDPSKSNGPDPVMDGDQRNFMKDVVEASREVPVLVDFWATWCGPCKTLTPALEKVVRAAGGRVRLVKIDIDKNRQLVQQLTQMGLPLQSVPTVAAFWQGQIADLFQGALPEGELKKFIENLLKMAGGQMPSAELLAEAKQLVEAGDAAAALEIYAALAQQEPENAEALAGLARCLIALEEEEQARDMLDGLEEKLKAHPEISAVRAQIELAEAGRAAQSQLGAFEQRLAANPDDHEARIELAVALNSMEKRTEAADALLEAIKRDREWNDKAAQKQLLKFFEAWGLTDPVTLKARRGLSALLFR
ncbi:tetratricopeptide repeat protein [Roseococcus sp. SDR]|uniref:tetratricopeptide repeat protein n=1 Tax=Roseococcus sp. SDR TaxID=2835532 RepID=UPI001BCAB888|nr:tetratricopeptide repeat protein [Roseococcus sp. SDR]MBS7791916.1 tetratricopeptide repeat protein [Roseococcus sp. SDR]MBV1847230.1 tetratricopeptide repeat protein [Roseococcus sp. SDR]